MKIFLFLVACVLALSVGGCADDGHQPAHPVSQKQPIHQTPTYSPATAAGIPGLQTLSVAPLPPASPPPVLQPKLKAAILLPLTGKNAALGQAMLNAAQQAVFDAAGTNFELQPHDTEGQGGAAEAARAALSSGAQLIIGPLFATDVPAVKAVAQSAGIEILPLSTDTSLAEHGVYVMGLAPTAQVERVVAYATAHGAHTFAALIPTTPYGALVGQMFANAVTQYGGTLIASESFDTLATGAARAKALGAQHDHIDALFLPESGSDLKNIADQCAASGFDSAHTHILGTGLWDTPALGKLSPLLIGGWYAAPDPATRRVFITSYVAAYGSEPPRLATLAYDATALAAVLAKHNSSYDEIALTNPNGFAGLDGIFRLMPSGVVERALAVNQVTADSAQVIDPAPTSFVAKSH